MIGDFNDRQLKKEMALVMVKAIKDGLIQDDDGEIDEDLLEDLAQAVLSSERAKEELSK